MPFGGAYQLTPQNAMVAKLPVDGETSTCSGMAWGFNPFLMSADQYKGAQMAVIESVTKLVASGFRYEDAYLTFQEYFERLGTAPCETVVFEDSLYALQTAKAAGFITVGVYDANGEADQPGLKKAADLYVKCLGEVPITEM